MTALMSHTELSPRPSGNIPGWIWMLFLALLTLAPISTKMAGAAWFLVICLGAWAFWRLPVMLPESSKEKILYDAVRWWLYFCIAAFCFKAIGMFYWDDPWRTRHFDFRILLMAFALRALVPRIRLSAGQGLMLVIALTLASFSAIAVSYMHAQYGWATPSNRINWAGGLAMLSCVLLPVTASRTIALRWRWCATAGIVVFVSAILMSGARGAYLAFPWILISGLVVLRGYLNGGCSGAAVYRAAALLAVCAVLVFYFAPKIIEVPKERISIAVAEIHAVLSDEETTGNVVDTSIGARIYMWQRSLDVIQESPWIGYGRAQRIRFIKEWGGQANAHIVKDQTHLHSEYINGMVDHGVFGLLSTLTYMAGLIFLTFILRRHCHFLAMSAGGLAYIHVMMSFTDANSQTNNYSVMIGLALSAIFLLRLGKRQGE